MSLIARIKTLSLVALWLLLVMPVQQARATHAAGADLTYTCLGGNTYRLEASFYRDCAGSNEPSSVTIRYGAASCGYSFSSVAAKAPSPNGQEITMPCAGQPSSCNGGFSTGLRKWVYQTVVTLPAACSDWVFSFKICCRNCSITTIQSPCATGSEIYVESRLNNLAAPGNSSPYFNNDPIAIMPIGQPFNYHQSVTDPDGDSLHYDLITPMTSATSTVTFLSPATTQSPLASSTPFSIDQLTGDIRFTPSMNQIGILAVKVSEFRNGNLIGSTIRDMQVYTYNSGNSVPSLSILNGSGSSRMDVCAGQQVCTTLQTTDPDSLQSLTASVQSAIPGAVISISPGPRPQVQFCWTPDTAAVRALPWILTVTVRDDACPVNGIQIISIPIYVHDFRISAQALAGSCPESASGSAQANALAPGIVSWQWNTNPQQYTATAGNLSPGTYLVTGTDPNGCMATDSVVITALPQMAIQKTVGNITCAGTCNGSVTLTVNSGAAPYTYQWSHGAATSSITGLCPGTYSCSITDANGCVVNDSSTVVPISNIQITSTVTEPACGDTTGAIVDLSVTGGILPYTYLWSDGSTLEDRDHLTAGLYSVTVTDSAGCVSVVHIQVTAIPSVLVVNPLIQPVSCFGGSNGSVYLQASGGTAPYLFTWQSGQTQPNLSGLTAGNYVYSVSDSNGCQVSGQISVEEPSEPVIALLQTNQIISCFGGNDGSLSVNVQGGTPDYTYQWNNGATAAVVSGLNAGVYTVTVTDARGCSQISTTQLFQPSSAISMTAQVQNSNCLMGQTGAIALQTNGGNPTYLYQWSTGDATKDLTGVSAGNYTVTVTDMTGCMLTQVFSIQDQSSLNLQVSPEIDLCIGQSTTLEVDSGSGGYEIQWYYSGSLLNGAVGPTLITPAGGYYYATATGPCGTFISDSVHVTVRSVQNAVVGPPRIICPPETTRLIASGGVSYVWSPDKGLNNPLVADPTAAPEQSTLYSVLITDAYGCTVSLPVQVMVSCDSLFIPSGFSPNADGINDGFVIDGIEAYPDNKIWIYNRWGALVYKTSGYENKWDGISNIRGAGMGSKVIAGTYFYILDLGDGKPPRNGYLIVRE